MRIAATLCVLAICAAANAADLETIWPELIEKLDAADQAKAAALKANIKLPAAKADAAPSVSSDALQLFCKPYWEAVNFNTIPSAEDLQRELRVAATPGEREPLTLCVLPTKDGTASVEIDDLKTSSGETLQKSNWKICDARYFFIRGQPNQPTVGPAYLQPSQALALKAGVTRQVWAFVRVPETAKPGIYKGRVRLKNGDTELASKTVTLEVYPFKLSELEDIDFGWFYHPCAAMEKEVADLREHGCNALEFPDLKFSTESAESGKRVAIDFSEWNKIADECHKQGMNGRHLFYALAFARKLMKKSKEFSPQFMEDYKDGMKQIFAWSKEHNIKLVAWSVDEPRERDINPWNRNYADTLKYLDALKEIPGALTMATPMRDLQHGKDYTPMLGHMDMVYTHPWDASSKLIKGALEAKKPFISYNSARDRLSFGFGTWRLGAKGRWQWHYAFMEQGQPGFSLDAAIAPKPGYAKVVYPAAEGPYASPIFELCAEGIDDYRYIYTLEKALAAAEGKTALEGARSAARQLLDKIRSKIPEYTDAGVLKGGAEASGDAANPAWRNATAEELRREIARAIASLNGGH